MMILSKALKGRTQMDGQLSCFLLSLVYPPGGRWEGYASNPACAVSGTAACTNGSRAMMARVQDPLLAVSNFIPAGCLQAVPVGHAQRVRRRTRRTNVAAAGAAERLYGIVGRVDSRARPAADCDVGLHRTQAPDPDMGKSFGEPAQKGTSRV